MADQAGALDPVRDIWAAVLGVEDIGPDDNFFELGGESITALRVAARLERTFGVVFPVTILFEAPTVRAVAQRIDSGNLDTSGRPGPGRAPLIRENRFMRRAVRPAPRVRLICLPHAGAGASVFAGWPGALPGEIEVIAIQPPGREDRAAEEPFTDVRRLVLTLIQVIRPYLDVPVALFGHSAGAMLAFELALALRERTGIEPVHLILSGQAAPGAGRAESLHELPDDEFLEKIRQFGGIDDELMADPHMARLILRVLRADFELWEKHDLTQDAAPFAADLTVLGGDADPRASTRQLAAWSGWTRGRFLRHRFPGGHFYLKTHREAVLRLIVDDLARRFEGVPCRPVCRSENPDAGDADQQ